MNPFKLVTIVAETNLLWPLERACRDLRSQGLPIELQTAHTQELDASAPIWEALRSADAAVVSMINTDAEARRIIAALQTHRPPTTLVFNCQPDLATSTRIGEFDARALEQGEQARACARAFQKLGFPLPPMPHVILAASPRLAEHIPDDHEELSRIKPYAQAARYWSNPSPQNLAALVEYLMVLAEHPSLPGSDRPEPAAPVIYPGVALWHPDLERPVSDLTEYRAWYEARGISFDGPIVGAVVFRQFVTAENVEHYRAVFRALEAKGIAVVGGYATLDNTPLVERYFKQAGIDLLLNLTGFNLVGSMGQPDPTRAVSLLRELDVPYLVAAPLLFQSRDEWERAPLGLHPSQVAIQVVTPELEGGIEPRIFGGRQDGARYVPIDAHVEALARRVHAWISLRRKPAQERRIAVTIFSFPPDKGSVGTAAYLDVFQSLFHVLLRLKEHGIQVEMPESVDALRLCLTGNAGAPDDRHALPLAGVLETGRYQTLVPHHPRIARLWGPAPGSIDLHRGGLAVRGVRFGNVFVGIQPSFGYEGDPMRLLLEPDASPSHSFAAYYAWLKHDFGADALVHFGTHGALEFMPGKQVGLTPDCFPDLLMGDLPHLYLYSANNPSEATIAKRRSGAVVVSHLSPPLAQAGLYKDLARLSEAVQEWEERERRHDNADTAWEIVTTLCARTGITLEEVEGRGDGARRRAAEHIKANLKEIEERLIPIGLHIVGAPLSLESLLCYLGAESDVGRAEAGVPPIAEILERLVGPSKDDAGHKELGSRLVSQFLTAGEDGVHRVLVPEGVTNPAASSELTHWLTHMERHRERLLENGEIVGVLRGLDGRYIPPSPGGDPVRSPDVLPTGRNIHALDPYRIPSPVAQAVADRTVDVFLDRHRAETGVYPRSVAIVLWGTDNIKSQGEGVAQVFALLGVRPVEDSLGRMTRLRLIPLEELGRPRIDVVMTVSGIFRDLFGVTADLLQQAVDLAAEADEPADLNFVRSRVRASAERLGVPPETAGYRVFTNAAGAYGTGVNHIVDSSEWEERADLAEVYLARKSYALARGEVHAAESVLREALTGVQATLQNVDSSEIGLGDVDHYYEYLGGLNAAVEQVSGGKARSYISDTLGDAPRVRSLAEEVTLEARTKLLNPKWYDAMLAHGYQGVHEVAGRLDHTFGWSATSDAVAPWIYQSATDAFALDPATEAHMQRLNPGAFKRIVGRLLEADARGYWLADAARKSALLRLFSSLESAQEGVVGR